MHGAIWAFLRDPGNQAVLGWIGGGIVVVAGGVWGSSSFLPRVMAAGA